MSGWEKRLFIVNFILYFLSLSASLLPFPLHLPSWKQVYRKELSFLQRLARKLSFRVSGTVSALIKMDVVSPVLSNTDV